MKTKFIIHVFLLVSFLVFFVDISYSQDGVKITANYSNLRGDTGTFLGIPYPVTESHAVTANVDYKVYSYEYFRVGAIVEFSTNFNGSRFHQYSAGSQVSFKLFENKLEPYIKLLFGVHRTEDSTNNFLKSLGVGVDVNVSKHFFIRPIQFDKQFVNNFPININRISSGIGVRFGGQEYIEILKSNSMPLPK